MSSLTAETREVWVVVRHDPIGHPLEIYECYIEEEAIAKAREVVANYVTLFNSRCWCTIEHRVEPIYK